MDANKTMAVCYTIMARIKDWKALQRLSDQTLIGYARAAGATRYRIFRNVHNAAEVLLIAEFPDHDAVRQMNSQADGQLSLVVAGAATDDRIWEPIDCQSID